MLEDHGDDLNVTDFRTARQCWRDIDSGTDAKRFEQLIRTLRGNSK